MKLKLLFTLLTLIALPVSAKGADNVICVKAGDTGSLLSAIEQANRQNADTLCERLFILIPDGTYDLGELTLTAITGHNISLVGQSMEGTVIVNAPKAENEGIGKTATLLNRGYDTYVQDLTLRNALDYYNAGAAGRAVCWQDKGSRTIMKRVRMLSYQDTYYSDNETCQHYFEEAEIHGTIDFICGAGDVYFNRCLLVTEKRNPDGSGRNVIAAPRTSVTPWGYVFDHCTVRNIVSPFHYARGWHTHPRCAWLYTRLESPEKLERDRFDPRGMRTVNSDFLEYHTTDADGRIVSPSSNVITFTLKDERRTLETIMQAEAARRFTVKNVFPGWRPEKTLKKLSKQASRLQTAYLR